jgi:hypothetical protein
MNRSPSDVRDPSDRAETEAMQRDPLVVRYLSLRYVIAQKRIMDRCAVNAHAGAPRLALSGATAITTLLRPLGVRIHGQG